MFILGKIKKLKAENEWLKGTMKFKNERLEMKESLIQRKNEEIRILKKNELILLQNAELLRKRNTDLENNIEFLYNNLTPAKRKLIRPEGKGEKSE